ncbi:MAG: hypothetical protein J6T10_28880 [Methanobrevibacter sp.]|nr:hypothetical protein [Methanobrevibacter sp.]
MNKILQEQLMRLMTAHFEVDGKQEKDFPESFSEIVFFKKDKKESIIKVTFEDYIINPFSGFDLHEKWNNGIKPYAKVMYGKIKNETKGMYQFEVHSEANDKVWIGWCPKKSCIIEEIY